MLLVFEYNIESLIFKDAIDLHNVYKHLFFGNLLDIPKSNFFFLLNFNL